MTGQYNIIWTIKKGVLSAIVTQIFSYYSGSSMGSTDKNKIIESMHD